MKKFLISLSLLLFSACVSSYGSGTKVDPQTLSQFQKGRTTYSEVVQALGPPNNTSTMADGSKMIMYIATDTQHTVSPLAPLMGVPTTMQSQSVTLVFGSNDVLKYYTTSQNNYGGGNSSVGLR